MQDTPDLLQRLLAAGLDFVIVGGVAAAVHGVARNTDDLDITAAFTPENMARLLAAVMPLHPRHVSRPDLGEIRVTAEELARYRNIYLLTDHGRLDVLGELPPVGGFVEVDATADRLVLFGRTCKVIGLDPLITIKESLNRPKDQETAVELKAIRDRLRNQPRRAP